MCGNADEESTTGATLTATAGYVSAVRLATGDAACLATDDSGTTRRLPQSINILDK